MKTILLDYHHPQLLSSLLLLFEKRLGMQVILPFGHEWWDEGYFNYYDNEQQTREFLHFPDMVRGVVLDEAKRMKIDYIVSTIPLKEGYFIQFQKDHHPDAKFIVVVGNVGYEPIFPNILTSTCYIPNTHHCFFHQEFDTKLFDMEGEQVPKKVVSSFLHYERGFHDYRLFQEYKAIMNDFEFRSYGFECTDGLLKTDELVSKAMKESMFIWHVKHVGEGYGHTIHTAACMGKPMIFKRSYTKNMLAEKYLIHGETGIDLEEADSPEKFAHDLRRFSTPSELTRMGNNLRKLFHEHVNFDKEWVNVADFMNQCV